MIALIVILAWSALALVMWDRRKYMRRKAEWEDEFQRRPRAIITKVGQISGGHLNGWHMDCRGEIPAMQIVHSAYRTEILIGGYTLDELREIAKRPSEFEVSQ